MVSLVTVQPIFYARPESASTRLRLQPRLASWNAAGHRDQVRLSAALDDAAAAVVPTLDGAAAPLTLRLDVGLPLSVPLVAEHDLDNYAYPLAAHLAPRVAKPIVSVWCTKQHSPHSFVRAESAAPAGARGRGAITEVRTSASASTTAYKQQIHDQVVGTSPLPEGPVALEIAFVVGPRRNWLNVWKPTIDALDLLLGRTRPDRDWHPRDGRITELGLHCTVDGAIGNEVVIAIRADPGSG
jgi:hypothetical protein